MKKILVILMSVLAVAGVAWADKLEQGFQTPPASARPWVYWFWLNGNVNREGITADLEAMRRVGIGGVLIVEVDQGTPRGPVAFASPAWRGLFKFALTEAHRLGLEVNMINDAGWCGSGGPWITPELSQKKIVWTETSIRDPKQFDGLLPRPEAVRNFYRDIAVLAFPTPAGESLSMADFSPKITAGAQQPPPEKKQPSGAAQFTLPWPEKGKPQYIQIEFARPFAARSWTASLSHPPWVTATYHGMLQVSDDGKTFRDVRPFTVTSSPAVHTFDAVSARFFRIVFTDGESKMAKLDVGNLTFSPRFYIENIQAKAAFTPDRVPPRASWPVLPASVTIPRDHIVDLTSRLDGNGRLTWDAPQGNWTVLRIGYTTTGVENHPAPAGGLGLECDKLSQEGADAMFAGLMAKLIADSKPLVPNTLVSTHIDSWETGSQNWTREFREEFRRRRGYDLLGFLPVMTNRVVDSLEASERFLWDLRQTVSDLLVENYAGRFRELAHRHGMRLSIEAYDDCPCSQLTYAGQADEPMAEFWSWPKFLEAFSCTEMSSAAHVYGKRILGAEAFTANQWEKWQGYPGGLKGLGDWAFCEGINRFVVHRYAMQPWAGRKPGMSMGPWGLHYERTQTWWEQSTAWHQYLARCQFLLQQGLFVADICCLDAEGSPGRFVPPPSLRWHDVQRDTKDLDAGNVLSNNSEAIPDNIERGRYNFDGCPPEVVLTRMTVKNGRLVLPDGMSYRLLLLPEARVMTPRLLTKIKQLVEAGATVVGAAPVKSPSLTDYPRCDDEVKLLAAELWGKGKVIADKTPAQVLADLGVPPDFAAQQHLRYCHRQLGDTEVYFVANGQPHSVETVCTFRVAGKRPELWQPDTGQIDRIVAFDQGDGCTRIPLRLEPSGSVFVVFRPGAVKPSERVVSVTRDGRELLVWSAATPKTRSQPDQGPVIDLVRGEVRQSGTYVLKMADGRSRQTVVSDLPEPLEIGGPWEVRFAPGGGAPARVTLDKLISWSAHRDPGIKYFSGTGTYLKTVKVSAEMLGKNRRIYLDLGNVQEMAEVKLNGRDLGILWKRPYRVDVTGSLKGGDNALEVKVVNLWINRQIGDEQLPEDSAAIHDGMLFGVIPIEGTLREWPKWLGEGKASPTGRYTFTTWRLWHKNDPLVESGLLGPVRLQTAQRIGVQ